MRLLLTFQLALLPLALSTVGVTRAEKDESGDAICMQRSHAQAAGSILLASHSMSLVRIALVSLYAPLSSAAQNEATQFVKADLRRYDGSDESLAIMIAIQGIAFDVSSGSNFYSKEGPYNQLVGKDSSLAVGLMSLEQADLDAEDDISSLETQGIEDLNTVFYETYVRKYPIVGLVTDSRAIPPGKDGVEWLAEVKVKQDEMGGPAALHQSKGDL